MQRRTLAVLTIIGTAGCAARQPTTSPQAAGSRVELDEMSTLIGSWNAEFHYDSVRGSGGVVEHWRAASHRVARGRIVLTAPSQPIRPFRLSSDVRVSFDSAFGRPMSCYTPGRGSVAIEAHRSSVTIRFTPDVADCGFSGEGRLEGDSIVGAWSETSIAGPVAMGAFRMHRTK
jgi:hypothetical protein